MPNDQAAYSFLALGDSYTIGEGVNAAENFPFQTAAILRAGGHSFHDPVILARTGWTTGELIKALGAAALTPPYDFVSLLIGVNNEYRGLPQTAYEREFRSLLDSAIHLAGDRPQRTFILSIPDWSVTPFAAIHLPDSLDRDAQAVSREIDQFNQLAARHAAACGVEFIDTAGPSDTGSGLGAGSGTSSSSGTGSRSGTGLRSGSESSRFASDGLHPSGSEYGHWAKQLAMRIQERLTAAPQ